MTKHQGTVEHTPASIRVALGLTQAQVAESAKISRPTLIALERGQASSVTVLQRVAQVYGVPVEDLLAAAERVRLKRAG